MSTNNGARPITFLANEVEEDGFLHKAIVRMQLEGIDKQTLGVDSVIIGHVEVIRSISGEELFVHFYTFDPLEFEQSELDMQDKVIIYHRLSGPDKEEQEFTLRRIFGSQFTQADLTQLAKDAAVEASRMVRAAPLCDNAEIYSVEHVIDNRDSLGDD